jgi:hypothetical protein
LLDSSPSHLSISISEDIHKLDCPNLIEEFNAETSRRWRDVDGYSVYATNYSKSSPDLSIAVSRVPTFSECINGARASEIAGAAWYRHKYAGFENVFQMSFRSAIEQIPLDPPPEGIPLGDGFAI